MYIYLHVKDLLYLSCLNNTWIFSTDFWKIPTYQIPWKSVQWELSCSMWMDRRRDMTKCMDTFCNFVNTSDNMYYQRHDQKMYRQKLTELFRFTSDVPERNTLRMNCPTQSLTCTAQFYVISCCISTVNGTSLVVTYANTRGCTSLSEYMSLKHSTYQRKHKNIFNREDYNYGILRCKTMWFFRSVPHFTASTT
jgi:hypothetical protein